MGFSDLPDEKRMDVLRALDSLGCASKGYDGDSILVAFPRGGFCDALNKLRDFDLSLQNDEVWYFPLGSDNPPEIMRHDGRYPNSRGFWCYGRFSPNGR